MNDNTTFLEKVREDSILECWNWLYYEQGMKDLADEMLEILLDKSSESQD